MAIDDVPEEDQCPRPGCGLPYSSIGTTDRPFQQRTVNLTAAKTCFIPRRNGEGSPAVTLVYHTHNDIVSAEFDKPHWAEWREIDPDHDADPTHARDLSGEHETVFEIIKEWTADDEKGHIKTGELRPLAVESGVSKDDLYSILLNLIYHEFVIEYEPSCFKAVPEKVIA